MGAGAILDRSDNGPEFRFSGPVFETGDQIRAAALEEAARVCDEQSRMCLHDLACAEHPADMTRLEIREEQAKTDAAEIRSLKEAR